MAIILHVMLMRRGIQKKINLISSDTTAFKHYSFKIKTSECVFFFCERAQHLSLSYIISSVQ